MHIASHTSGSRSRRCALGGQGTRSIAWLGPSRGFGATRRATSKRRSTSSGQPAAFGKLRRLLIGEPIHSELEVHERLTKKKALAVFSSDALSSVAYAPQETLIVLLAAGAAAAWWSLPIALAVIALLAIVVTSYRQTIYTYPSGGGSYIVAKDNLGELPGPDGGRRAGGRLHPDRLGLDRLGGGSVDRGRADAWTRSASGWASGRSG